MRTLAIRPAREREKERKNQSNREEEREIKTHDELNFLRPGDRSELEMPATYRKFATKIKARVLPNFVTTIRRVARAEKSLCVCMYAYVRFCHVRVKILDRRMSDASDTWRTGKQRAAISV